jgi:hypothetical protein
MSIVPTIIVIGVSLLFVSIALTPTIIELLPKAASRPDLTVLPGGNIDTAANQRPHAA